MRAVINVRSADKAEGKEKGKNCPFSCQNNSNLFKDSREGN